MRFRYFKIRAVLNYAGSIHNILFTGCPNNRGIQRWFWYRLCKQLFDLKNSDAYWESYYLSPWVQNLFVYVTILSNFYLICYNIVKFLPDLLQYCQVSTWSVIILSNVYLICYNIVKFLPDLLKCCQVSTWYVIILSNFYLICYNIVKFLPDLLQYCQVSTWSVKILSNFYVICYNIFKFLPDLLQYCQISTWSVTILSNFCLGCVARPTRNLSSAPGL